MTPECFKKRMPGCDPLQVIFLCRIAICRKSRIFCGQRWKFPIGLAFVASEGWWSPDWIESMWKRWDGFEGEWDIFGRIKHKPGNGFRDQATLLSPGTTLNEHLKI